MPVRNLPTAAEDMTHDDALQVIYARIADDNGLAAAALRALLPMHVASPSVHAGQPDPACSFCHGAGQATVDHLGPQPCGCAWPICTGCTEALIGNRPCDQVATILEAVLAGVPAGAVAVARTVQQGRVTAIAHTAITDRLGDGPLPKMSPVRSVDVEAAGTLLVRVDSGGNSLAVEEALSSHGYTVEAAASPDGWGCALRVTPPPGPLPSLSPAGPVVAADRLAAALAVTLAAEDAAEDAGILDADDRRTCHTHKRWAGDCAGMAIHRVAGVPDQTPIDHVLTLLTERVGVRQSPETPRAWKVLYDDVAAAAGYRR